MEEVAHNFMTKMVKLKKLDLLDYVEASSSLVSFDGFKQAQLELIKFAKCWDLID